MAIPTNDASLIPYATNFNSLINAAPADFALVIGQCTQFTSLLNPYLAAANAIEQAREVGARSKAMTEARDTARNALLVYARELYAFIQANTSVTNENKAALGIVVKDTTRTPAPIPQYAPLLNVTSVTGNIVKVLLRDSQTPHKRGKPGDGVQGANVFSFVGENPPAPDQWKFEGQVQRVDFEIIISDSVPAGSKVWLTANWYNTRGENGPTCGPVSTFTQFGGTTVEYGVMSLAA